MSLHHVPTVTDGIDPWQQSTLRANTEFKLACYGNAILMHNRALDEARSQFGGECGDCRSEAMNKVLISHFHLADCYKALAQVDRAADCYLEAQRFLLQAQYAVTQNESARERFLHAHGHLHAMWGAFTRQFGAHLSYDRQLCYHRDSAELRQHNDAMAVRH